MSKKTKNNKPPERLFLLDGMALAYRAFFSFISRPLINSKGENTSAVFGFVNTLMKILDDEKPDHIAVVFDTREPTFRHVMYDAYKATRQKMPEGLSAQMEKLKEVVKAFNVPCIELPGYEADDIMGTLARMAEREGVETFLVTGDKDFMQLVTAKVKMYRPGKRGDEWEVLDDRAVQEKFGVTPDLVIDVLGLVGDKSDNVPGVPGIGEKTAIPLVQQYGSIEKILNNVDKIPQNGLRQKLRDHQDEAYLSKKLVTIDTNVPLTINFHELNARPADTKRLIELFSDLEFRSLIKKLGRPTSPDVELQPADSPDVELVPNNLTDIGTEAHVYHVVTSERDFQNLLSILERSSLFAFDTETTSKDPLRCELIGVSFAMQPREAWYVPLDGSAIQNAQPEIGNLRNEEAGTATDLFTADTPDEKTVEEPTKSSAEAGVVELLKRVGLPRTKILERLRPILSNPRIKKVGHNLKYDMLVMSFHGVRIEGACFDTMIANYILRPDSQHSMDAVAADQLRYKTISYDDLTGTGKDRKEIRDVELSRVAEYAAEDADVTIRLYETLRDKLQRDGLLTLCDDIEFPLIQVLADIELAGVSLDVPFLADLSKEFEREIERLKASIFVLAGENFNVNSTQQLSKILFEKLKLAAVRKTKTGYSTDVWVLETLRHAHPIIEQLLDYRQLQKLKSTYVDALPALINPRTGRLHTSFNQTITTTGRLSSSNPNLQNIPIRTELGRGIRKAFIPASPELRMLSADYSQIELRIMAHVSGDEALVTAFENGEDIHATTAEKIFGVTRSDITHDMRRKAKEVNFGVMYGIGPYGLATRLDISQSEARQIIDRYFVRFPKVSQYIADTLAKARQDGYVSTLLGRRRYFPDINSRNFSVRSNAERQAINMPIQGTAADMIKRAMVNIHRSILGNRLQAKMVLQVHDELVFEVLERDIPKAKKLIIDHMKTALPLSVPIEVEVGFGRNWLEAH
jgi:DNA polymerase-1